MAISLEARNIVVKKGRKTIIDDLSFQIEENDFFVVLGEKNSGKTELVKVLASVIKPKFGEVLFYGENTLENKKLVSYIPQNMALSRQLTVYENMELILRINGVNIINAKSRIDEMLKKYNLFDRADDKVFTLSDGLNKRLSIAMGLATNPKIILIDEPTENLNTKSKRDIFKMIEELKGKYTVVLFTHTPDLAELLNCTVCLLNKGYIVAMGKANELKEKYDKDTLEDILAEITEEE